MKCYPIKVEGIDVDNEGQNENLRFHIIDNILMKNIGFNHTNNEWVLVDGIGSISINIVITDDLEGSINVLDCDFLQPYDFQEMIIEKGDNAPKLAIEIQYKLYTIFDSMKTFGVLEGWEWGDYV